MDDVINLVKETTAGYDIDGNEVPDRTKRQVFCKVFGVTRSEFYQAALAGLHPEIVVRLSDCADYEGEKLAEYNGVLYSVVRAYRDRSSTGAGRAYRNGMDLNAIELVLERKVGDDEPDDRDSDGQNSI